MGKLLASRAAANAAETVLFEGGKDALQEALAGAIKGVNSQQAGALLETLKEGSADMIKVVTGENGLVSYTTRAGHDGYQTLVRIFNESGELKRMAQAAWDAAGRFVHGEVWK